MKNFLILLLLLIATTAQAQFTAFNPAALPNGTLGLKGDLLGNDGTIDGIINVGADGEVLTANSAATYGFAWTAVATPISDFVSLIDTPADFVGASLQSVRVNVGETALEYYTPVVPTYTFSSLTDTPANFTGASLQSLRVNVGETGVEYYTPAVPTYTFSSLTDTPASYATHSLKSVRVNVGETALEYYTPPVITADVIGPVLNTDLAIAIWDGLNSKTLKDSKVFIDADGRVSQTGLGGSTYFGEGAGITDDLTANSNTGFGFEAGKGVTVGTKHVFVGYNSGSKVTSGTYNTFIGADIATVNASAAGGANTVVGGGSFSYFFGNTANNTLIGARVGTSLYGGNNTILGTNSGQLTTSGASNILVGFNIDAPTATTSNWLNIGGVIESDMTTGKILMDAINLVGLPVHADEAAAAALTTGDVYQTVTGELRIKL